MNPYKTLTVVTPSKQVVLSDIPFGVGDKVPIIVSRSENGPREHRVRKLKALFKKTQSLPQIHNLTEDEIEREVEAHRSDR